MNDHQHGDEHTQAFVILKPGAVFAHYNIISNLGVGGMGEVFLADDSKLHRKVALKFLSPNLASDKQFHDRFLREARSAAALNHPNIVTIYEVSEFSDRVYIAMEFVEGKTLRELMDHSMLSTDNILDMMIQICDGLQAAHEIGLVHRDIKPLNILLDKNNRVRILDFGLAKGSEDVQLTQAGVMMGSVNYMSPEQCEGNETDNRSDIFSLGIVLFELLTNNLPFKTGNLSTSIYSIVNDQPLPMDQFKNTIPEQLQQLVNKTLLKPPGERYQNILDLKNDIVALRYNVKINESALMPSQHTSSSMTAQSIAPTQDTVNSLAVLYLNNLGAEEDEFLSYGITEDLIVDLTRSGTVRVSPMRSVLKFKDSTDDLEEIAQKLKVNMILDGSIHRIGDTIRVSAQLVNVTTGDNIWAERWQESVDNLPRIKKDLAEGIGSSLNIGQTVIRKAQIGQPESKNANAYENYLKGKYYFERRKDKSDVDIAVGLYRQALKDEPSLLAAQIGIAEIKINNSEFDEARTLLESSLEKAKIKDKKADQAWILQLMTRLLSKQSKWSEALQFGEQALLISHEVGDLDGEATTLGLLISIHQNLGDHDKVVSYFERVLEISRKLNDQDKTAEALKNMGIAYVRRGDYRKALSLYDEALALARKQENLSLEGACLSNIGNVYFFQNKLQEAYDHYQKSLEIAQRLGDNVLSARQNLNMGIIQLRNGHFEKGIALLESSSALFLKLDDRLSYVSTLNNISQASLNLADFDRAISTAEEALKIAREMKHPFSEANALIRLSTTYYNQTKYDDAIKTFNEALIIAEKLSITRNVAQINMYLARTYYMIKDNDSALKFAEDAFRVSKNIGDQSLMSLASSLLGALEAVSGMFNMGVKQISDAIKETESTGDKEFLIDMKTTLGYIMLKFGKSDEDTGEGRIILTRLLDETKNLDFHLATNRIQRILA